MIVRLISVRRRKLFWDGFFKFSDVILCYDSFHFDVRSHNKHNVLDSVGFNEYALEPVNNSPSSVAFAQWVRHAFSHRTIGQIIRLLDFFYHYTSVILCKLRIEPICRVIDRPISKLPATCNLMYGRSDSALYRSVMCSILQQVTWKVHKLASLTPW